MLPLDVADVKTGFDGRMIVDTVEDIPYGLSTIAAALYGLV